MLPVILSLEKTELFFYPVYTLRNCQFEGRALRSLEYKSLHRLSLETFREKQRLGIYAFVVFLSKMKTKSFTKKNYLPTTPCILQNIIVHCSDSQALKQRIITENSLRIWWENPQISGYFFLTWWRATAAATAEGFIISFYKIFIYPQWSTDKLISSEKVRFCWLNNYADFKIAYHS